MELTSEIWRRRQNGTISVQTLTTPGVGSPEFLAQVANRFRLHWHPPHQIDGLPSDFELALDCYVAKSGLRRFTLPEWSDDELETNSFMRSTISNAEQFAKLASAVGYQLMVDRGEWQADLFQNIKQCHYFLAHIKRRREFFNKRKNLSLELPTKHSGASIGSILPANLGLAPDGSGKSWTAQQFRTTGRKAALKVQIFRPTEMQIASYAFLDASILNPLHVRSPKAIAAIIKSTLFAPESTSQLTNTQLRNVAVHVQESLRAHLTDPDKINLQWIADPNLNLLNYLAVRVKLSPEQIRHALTELGWRAFRIVAKCIDTLMRAFRDSIPTPLSKREHFYFREQFLANSKFGGLPLLLLLDRHNESQAAVLHVWNRLGDREAIAVFHRAMAFIGETLANRRTADREYKREALARNKDGKVARKNSSNVDSVAQPRKAEDGIILQVAKYLADRWSYPNLCTRLSKRILGGTAGLLE